MKVRFILLLVTTLSATAWAGEWLVTKPVAGGEYVFCKSGDCLERTVKIVDLGVLSPAMPVAEKPKPVMTELVLQFGMGSARLSLADKAKIAEWRALVPPGSRIVVMGSTDRIGTRGFNRRLADHRAKTVARALEASGAARGLMRLDAQCCIGHPPSNNPKVRRVTVRVQDMEMK